MLTADLQILKGDIGRVYFLYISVLIKTTAYSGMLEIII